jgi:hypothetical protein
MVTKMNLEGTKRKAMVTAIEELTGLKGIYQKTPTYNFDFGELRVLRDGSIDCSDDWNLIEQFKEKSFFPMDEDEPTTLSIEIPNNLTEGELDGLNMLIASKEILIHKVTGAESLEIRVIEERLAFPWFAFTEDNEADETAAYRLLSTRWSRWPETRNGLLQQKSL